MEWELASNVTIGLLYCFAINGFIVKGRHGGGGRGDLVKHTRVFSDGQPASKPEQRKHADHFLSKALLHSSVNKVLFYVIANLMANPTFLLLPFLLNCAGNHKTCI